MYGSQIAPGLKALLRKLTVHLKKPQSNPDHFDERTHFLATCFGSLGCADARARVQGLGCHVCVCASTVEPIGAIGY
jgi:hypothetical protein